MRFQYDGPKNERKAAVEEAWKNSQERRDCLWDMPLAEQRKRRYI